MSHLVDVSPSVCRELLGGGGTGRAVFTEHALPAVATLNYAVRGERLFFRTDPRSVLARAATDGVIAFNVDHVDTERRSGWSVTVSGRCRPVTAPDDLTLDTWAPGTREQVFALDLAHLTGRILGSVQSTGCASSV